MSGEDHMKGAECVMEAAQGWCAPVRNSVGVKALQVTMMTDNIKARRALTATTQRPHKHVEKWRRRVKKSRTIVRGGRGAGEGEGQKKAVKEEKRSGSV